jgi:hypothetical protein
MTKTTLEAALPNFPNEFSIDEIVERLILIEKIENGRKQYAEGKTLTSEEVKLKMQEWSK